MKISFMQISLQIISFVYISRLIALTDLMAGAVVGPDGVPADVLATPVVGGALVLVREEDGGEAVLLYGVIREKLQPQAVPLRGDYLKYATF